MTKHLFKFNKCFSRQREHELLKNHKAELKSTASYHEQKTQLLLAEFNKAKEILSQELTFTKEKYANFLLTDVMLIRNTILQT